MYRIDLIIYSIMSTGMTMKEESVVDYTYVPYGPCEKESTKSMLF
jgi:hypothetical protein